MPKNRLTDRTRLIVILLALLVTGFLATSVVSYLVSRSVIRKSIVQSELPLTSDNIYSEIQKNLTRPVFISSMMSRDTFLRDWILSGEQDTSRIQRYLREIKEQYGMFTSFFVSEKSRNYYYYDGILKRVNEKEWRDVWYFRVREMTNSYEINVDIDLANRDALTIFVNYRVNDYGGKFLGAAGVGLTVEAVRGIIDNYGKRFGRQIFFTDRAGKVTLSDRPGLAEGASIASVGGLNRIFPSATNLREGAFQYRDARTSHLLNIRYLPELGWYLFVERVEDEALSGIRSTLALNIIVCFAVTLLVLLFTTLTINRFQAKIEDMASTDQLTGLVNRQALELLFDQMEREMDRSGEPASLMLLDVDHFKAVNDTYGHLAGDEVLKRVTDLVRARLRESDIFCRWSGEEFLVLMKACGGKAAKDKAEMVRQNMESSEVHTGETAISLTVSIGVAQFLPGEKLETALKRVVRALYVSKETGRNRVTADIPD
jgi:diguanylate cyclase (GGDEF)-like protein